MKKLLLIIILLLASCGGPQNTEIKIDINDSNKDAVLNWDAPTTRVDNSVLSPSEIGGYKIYYGKSNGVYLYNETVYGNITTYTIKGLPNGTWYFVVTCFDINSLESDYSIEVGKTI